MDPVSPFPAIVCLLVAVATSRLLVKEFGLPPARGRYSSIDGLRGYLAFFVFLHHSCIWYFYLRTDQWEVPPSNLYTHFGQSSVSLFFMITGFLFFSKLIDGRKGDIDWGKLFISRLLRLVPLYLFSMLLFFFVVYYISNGVLNEPFPKLLKGLLCWVGFTILGAPNLNGIEDTSIILAGITWPLPYWWFFYFSLPILALTVGVTPPFRFLALGLAGIVGFAIWQPEIHHVMSFLGGIAASVLVKLESFRRFAFKKISSFISLACISIVVVSFPSAYSVVPLFLLSVAFVLIACGNTMFGVLVSPLSRTIGEMAYSIYSLHGITLFVVFNFIVGEAESRSLSSFVHWLLVVGITPILILGCFITFRLIESPAIRSSATITIWLRTRLTLRSETAPQAARR